MAVGLCKPQISRLKVRRVAAASCNSTRKTQVLHKSCFCSQTHITVVFHVSIYYEFFSTAFSFAAMSCYDIQGEHVLRNQAMSGIHIMY